MEKAKLAPRLAALSSIIRVHKTALMALAKKTAKKLSVDKTQNSANTDLQIAVKPKTLNA